MNNLAWKLMLCLSCMGVVSAQQAGVGSISRVVYDSSHPSVLGAKVVVANESKGITRNLETNAEGIFTAPSLVPAAGYSITVNASGFTAYERKDITLSVGQNVNINVPLQVSGAAQTVEVTV